MSNLVKYCLLPAKKPVKYRNYYGNYTTQMNFCFENRRFWNQTFFFKSFMN